MIDEIEKSITERVSKHTSSMCASRDEVWICWLLAEVERLKAALQPMDEWYAKKFDFTIMEKLLDKNCSKGAENLAKASLAWQEMGERKAAKRCADIVRTHKHFIVTDGGMWPTTPTREDFIAKIHKEFGIDKGSE